jgi:hypothetical protein
MYLSSSCHRYLNYPKKLCHRYLKYLDTIPHRYFTYPSLGHHRCPMCPRMVCCRYVKSLLPVQVGNLTVPFALKMRILVQGTLVLNIGGVIHYMFFSLGLIPGAFIGAGSLVTKKSS